MYTRATKGKVLAGLSSPRGACKVPFTDVYPGWAGAHGVSNLDAGLVELYDINKWTAQIFRLGIMGEPIDLNMDTLNVGIIDSPLIAHGGASGIMKGRLLALFYRYHSMGGEDYIADFLIGPDGRVQAAKYGRHADDQWSVDELLNLAGRAGG